MAARGWDRCQAWGLRRVTASPGVEAVDEFAEGGKKPSDRMGTGLTPITDQPRDGVTSGDTK